MNLLQIKTIVKSYEKSLLEDKLKIILRLLFCIKPIIKVIEDYLPKQGLIIDLGCGYGIISNLIAGSCLQRKIIAVDLSSHRIDVAKSCHNENITFINSDIRKFDIPNCDSILMIDILCMISFYDQLKILSRCYERLNSDGVMIIKDTSKSPRWKYIYTRFEESIKSFLGIYGKEVGKNAMSCRDSHEMVTFLEKSGFSVKMIPLKTILPYPGVFYICRK